VYDVSEEFKKLWSISTRQHFVTFQKAVFFRTTAQRTLNFRNYMLSVEPVWTLHYGLDGLGFESPKTHMDRLWSHLASFLIGNGVLSWG
jgi:hypothetical protein